MPMPDPGTRPHLSYDEGSQSLYSGGNCPDPAGGGCVSTISRGVIDSVQGVPNAHREMVKKQLADLQQRGQKVITCVTARSTRRPGPDT